MPTKKVVEDSNEKPQLTKKYYVYDSGQSVLSIPIRLAEGLGWKHLDEIEISIEFLNGEKGLFLKKPKKKK